MVIVQSQPFFLTQRSFFSAEKQCTSLSQFQSLSLFLSCANPSFGYISEKKLEQKKSSVSAAQFPQTERKNSKKYIFIPNQKNKNRKSKTDLHHQSSSSSSKN